MEVLVSTCIIGLLIGAVYGLFSVGLSLSFGVLRLVNFAHGDFVMLGMYAAAAFVGATAVGIYWSLPLVALAALPVGYVVYTLFFRGTGGKASHDQLIISLGLALLLETAMLNVFGPNARALNPLSTPSVSIGWLHLPQPQMVASVVAAVATLALDAFLMRTRLGKSVRAVVADREVATLLGINDRMVFTVTFVLSIVLAGVAGVVLYGFQPVTPETGSNFILIGFMVVVLGGIGDIRGTFAAGLLVGLVETLTATYVDTSVQDVAVYAAFVLTIVALPKGLFGRGAIA